ncbi:cytosolic sulfotransferase 5-like [Triticum dicoccoides]|uniref:cytosolic sulfotransferase 5-like n=1 Tax=Triticum dicoccoides TaxID=85692 RepID=UPI001890A1BC|nr:cytosolic sulfotransferase 5-like [Triticum dicoccoides]
MAQPPAAAPRTSSPEGATTQSSPDDALSEESLKEFITSLPSREGWPQPLIQYKSYWFNRNMLEGVLRARRAFAPRAEDVILATQPKCGTTWLKALAFAVATRSRHGLGAPDHPLLTRHPQHLVPFIEIPGVAGRDHAELGALPSPRLLATHMPMSLLTPETWSLGCRVVYLCRDPKDTLVSRLHFENMVAQDDSALSMEDAFGMFCEGFSPKGPFWDHCLDYWKESMARPDTVLFLKYEEIKLDPARVVKMLASFLGVPLTEEEESCGVAQEVATLCSFEKLTRLQVNQVGGVDHGNKVYIYNSMFYRKGEVGDWANHMSREMGEKLDRIVQEKLQGSGLVF